MKKRKRILSLIAIPFLLIGCIGFLGAALINVGIIKYDHELPNSSIDGIVVDESGKIFLGLSSYGKMQVYDQHGNFLRNWKLNAEGGTFKMTMTNQNRIQVITARNNKMLVYNENGQLISSTTYKSSYSEFDKKIPNSSFIDKSGNLYEIHGLMFNTVVKNGDYDNPIISQGIFHKIFQGPMPAWLFVAFGMILLLIKGGAIPIGRKKTRDNDPYTKADR